MKCSIELLNYREILRGDCTGIKYLPERDDRSKDENVV